MTITGLGAVCWTVAVHLWQCSLVLMGMLRMFEMLRETEGVQTRVFRARQDALEWLTNGAVD